MSWDYLELLEKISDEKFAEIYSSCSRKIRNMIEGIYCKKSKKGRKVSLRALKDKSGVSTTVKNGLILSGDDQTADEIMKTWLYGKRDLLSTALDFFDIKNDDGITEQELDAFEEASKEKLEELTAHLEEKGFELYDIAIYIAYMQPEHFDEVDKLVACFS